ncbi:MAG: PTS system nitrogen regulatory IIA component [Gammaproteobacteria bacterium]|jgi:PTS system nitrogen regulatory IIA component
MEISEILSQNRVIKITEMSSKKAALESLARLISSADPVLTQFEVFESLIAREKLGSTGLGHGIALPHGRRKGGNQTIGAFMKLQTGVKYDAIDQKPVDLLFALLVPEQSTEEHLQVLSKLATIFNEDSLIGSLRECETAEAIFEILVGQ